ncbi:c-Myc-binding protein homolog [Anoplophora glabripennis]|uniref:c-Myc-binding protein homolog n=1 Tax=Anoplophora glabripennis TaxID=217634 RepID=UPI000873D82C|nr:c-Myc-binding protein homolog [Anoplophora glabripennis]XP_018565450.1 c-Myc-binding protein homolog [Anoplophora glabripennis]XP_018565451.1 c-Myc-binding protein homolog [Anoplophora glabripennis]XP_018565452.1 c-Myc-binding protein homolog [Anoplophora glabripennis]XP_018565453.1 c-Myc-binding protein homolog [Anoplophora glabripennis]
MSSNPNYKPSEGKREEFRKYLEKNGIMDALTKVLVNLYEEVDKPENALQYIIDKLSIQAGHETHDTLQNKLNEAEARVKELEEQLEAGAKVQPTEEPAAEGVGEDGAPDENLDPDA